jgi:deoxyribose-phosphate aldolase
VHHDNSGTPLRRRRHLSHREVAGHVELNLMSPGHSASMIAGLSTAADAVGCPVVLVAPEMVPIAARAVRHAMVGTAIEFSHPGHGGLSLSQVAGEAARFAGEGARAIGLVWTAERHQLHGTRRLYDEVRIVSRKFSGRRGLVRVLISCHGMSESELADAVVAARDAGATSLGAGAWCLPRQRMLDAVRLREVAQEGCLVKWGAPVRSLDVLLVAVAEGFPRVSGDPVALAKSALHREEEGGQVVVPLPGVDFLETALATRRALDADRQRS